MARPIAPTPILYGKVAEEFLKEMERVDREEFTPKEIEVRKKLKKIRKEHTSKIKH